MSPESDDDDDDSAARDDFAGTDRFGATKIRWGTGGGSSVSKDAPSFTDLGGSGISSTLGPTKTVAHRRWGVAARAYVADLRDDAKDALKNASDAFKTMLATQTISVEDVRKKRKVYIRKLKWKSVLASYQGWFLASFVWVFGGYVILVYGVLIYRYLGPGEESTYISTWGTAFLINTFGIESLKVVGRKMFFLYVITTFKKGFMKAADTLAWYETYTELVGMHLLAESGAYDGADYKADNADDGEGDGEGDGDGDGD